MPWNEGIRTFTAGEALAARRRVKKSSATVIYSDEGEDYIGVTEAAVASGEQVAVKLKNVSGTFEVVAAGAFAVNTFLYPAADGKVDDAVAGPPQFYSLEAASGDGSRVEALPIAAPHISAQNILNVPLMSAIELNGTVLAAFSAGTSNTPGISVEDTEGVGIRWNDAANPDAIMTSVPIPTDLDETEDVTVHVLASKSGATAGDAVTWDIGAFFLVDGALHDADADAGGTSSAMTGDADAKTLQEATLTILAADVLAAPGVLTLTLQPTDGTLGTDDVTAFAMWLEYTQKVLTT